MKRSHIFETVYEGEKRERGREGSGGGGRERCVCDSFLSEITMKKVTSELLPLLKEIHKCHMISVIFTEAERPNFWTKVYRTLGDNLKRCFK